MMKFDEKYNHDAFCDFLREFLPEDYTEKEKDIAEIQNCKIITEAKELGHSESLDVYVLEMTHAKDTDPRVTIATDAFRILANYGIDKALVIFKNDDSENYRFSYLTISLDLNDKNKIVRKYSNARRYSFYLGIGAKVKTPEQQLLKKGRVSDTDDLLSRFSLEVVNKQFYLEIAKLFDELVHEEEQNLALPFQSDPNVRKNFVMRLIGRLMFCWFLKQKKSPSGQLVPDELLSSGAVNDNYYHAILEPLFFEILNTQIEERDIRGDAYDKVPYLNGGLFSPQHDDYYDLDRGTFMSRHINTLRVSDAWFKKLFELLETYNFTIDENTVFDQELSVDPEMLGRIFENLLAEINPETGSSERKRTGSYYTPRQIVEYMVDQSLFEHLKTKTNIADEKLKALLTYDLNDDIEHPLDDDEKPKVIAAIDSLKVLDPVCGSGAFPMGTLQKIVWILQRIDPDCKLWLEQKLVGVPDLYKQKIINEVQSNPFDYTRKLDVIKNSIFGVDIQPIAVEMSRLRCFLTLVVESEVDDVKPNRNIDPLPNLDFKFVCANTLIGLPKSQSNGLFEDHSGIEELSAIMSEYFSCSHQRKSEIRLRFTNTQKEILNKSLSSFGKSTGDLTMKLSLWDPFSNVTNPWFDPEWMFGVDEKFDVVIANPPYIDSETMVKEQSELREQLSELYSTAKGNWDLFVPFIQRGIELLSTNGALSYIVPNKLIAAKYAESIRDYLLQKNILNVRDYSDVRVFKEASVYPIVFSVSGYKNDRPVVVEKMSDIETPSITNRIPYEIFESDIYWDKYFIDPKKLQLVIKLCDHEPLSKYNDQILGAATVSEAYKIKEIIADDCNAGDEYLKFINSGTIDPFKSFWGEKKTQYIKAGYQCPVVNKSELSEISTSRLEQSLSKKLVIAGMSKNLEVFHDEGSFIAGKSTTIILDNGKFDLKVLQAILNSKLISFWYQNYFSSLSLAGGYLRISNNEIKKIPIPKATNDSHASIVELASKIQKLKSENIDSSESEKELDEVIFELYGLNEEEKEIVRNS